MSTVLSAPTIGDTLQLSHEQLPTHLRRYCGDWLAQFLWAIDNGLEETVDLHGPPEPFTPRPEGALDPATGLRDPDLRLHQARVDALRISGYLCYVPPETRLGWPGRRVSLFARDVPRLRRTLAERGLLDVWRTYSAGGTYQIYSYHRASGGMQLTPRARRTPGIGAAAEALADVFAPQLLPAGGAGTTDARSWPA